jgi:hypothetical protein
MEKYNYYKLGLQFITSSYTGYSQLPYGLELKPTKFLQNSDPGIMIPAIILTPFPLTEST